LVGYDCVPMSVNNLPAERFATILCCGRANARCGSGHSLAEARAPSHLRTINREAGEQLKLRAAQGVSDLDHPDALCGSGGFKSITRRVELVSRTIRRGGPTPNAAA